MPYWDHEKSSLFGCFFSWPQGASYSLGRELPKPFQRSLLRSIRSFDSAKQPQGCFFVVPWVSIYRGTYPPDTLRRFAP